MRLSRLLLSAVLALTVSIACEQVTPESVTRTNTFTVPAEYVLEIEAFNGSVEIAVAEGDSLEVTAEIQQPGDVEYTAVLDGQTVRLLATAIRTRTDPSPGVALKITAPVGATLNVTATNGDVTSAGVGVGGTLKTSNGTIRLEEVTGDFDLNSSNGAIELDRVIGTFQGATSNGRIEFDGELTEGTTSELQTSNGTIDVFIGSEANVRLNAETSNGLVDVVYELDDATISDEHVEGTLGTGAATLILRTSNGDINIR